MRQGAVPERTLAVYVGQGAEGAVGGGPYSHGSGLLEPELEGRGGSG